MKKRHLAAPVAAALAIIGLSTPPAQAATYQCTDASQERRVSLPNKSDLDLSVGLCVFRTQYNEVYAQVVTSWSATTPAAAFGKKFDGFKVNARLEYRFSTGGVDYINKSHTCDFTASANDMWAATARCNSGDTPWDADLYWSADGQVQWDIDGDGKGWQEPWQLTGSPLLS
ncbi:hypothetical protein GR925_33405 [Streptomyces sp. HUCO-GS316]|uniref:hypothetical protein n=1 Tax=Streptomyces sp. HUCO-GS316 TaxID=2692198 RepID=UPI0013683418|nr:hypothetical protein [Streptomyces sp. HUCO-GS316]MXM68207.1 hypothetical protein [Streptomyces sp. HUCO-GS316]